MKSKYCKHSRAHPGNRQKNVNAFEKKVGQHPICENGNRLHNWEGYITHDEQQIKRTPQEDPAGPGKPRACLKSEAKTIVKTKIGDRHESRILRQDHTCEMKVPRGTLYRH